MDQLTSRRIVILDHRNRTDKCHNGFSFASYPFFLQEALMCLNFRIGSKRACFPVI